MQVSRTAKDGASEDPAGWIARVCAAVGAHPMESWADNEVDPLDVLREAHAKHGEEFAKLVADDSASREELFAAKNRTLALSIDAALAWSGHLYITQLAHVSDLANRSSPQTIVDLGCEQGLVSCFAAARWPDATVMAIDRSPAAIERARELADLMGISNIEFIAADFHDPKATHHLQAIGDLVLSSRAVLGEAVSESAEIPRELLTGEQPPSAAWEQRARRTAEAISRIAGVGGQLLSIERTDPTGMLRWANVLTSVGLRVLEGDCSLIHIEESGLPDQSFALVSARKVSGETDPPSRIKLLNAMAANAADKPGPWSGPAAEVHALETDLVDLVELSEWPSGEEPAQTEHLEAWTTADGELLEFRSSTTGARETTLHRQSAAAESRRRLQAEIKAHFDGPPPACEPLLRRDGEAIQ